MTYNQSIIFVAAVAAMAYWLGSKKASTNTAAAPQNTNNLDWLSGWSNA